MADDERRAEIEAVAYVLHEAPPEADLANVARECIVALDRARDARGDDEAAVWRSMLDRIRIHGASGLWTGEDCAIGAVAALEGGDAGRAFMLEREAARSPQDEDHEAGLRAALNAYYDRPLDTPLQPGASLTHFEKAIAAYLSRVSPSRDGTVAVEDVVERLLKRANGMSGDIGLGIRTAAKIVQVEFSPASTGDREENDERRH